MNSQIQFTVQEHETQHFKDFMCREFSSFERDSIKITFRSFTFKAISYQEAFNIGANWEIYKRNGYTFSKPAQPIPGTSISRYPISHQLKTWPTLFFEVADGNKAFEIRKADRDFRVNDWLELHEWNPDTGLYTGHAVRARIRLIIPGGMFGIEAGYVALGLSDLDYSFPGLPSHSYLREMRQKHRKEGFFGNYWTNCHNVSHAKDCPECGGSGEGAPGTPYHCSECNGSGVVPDDNCPDDVKQMILADNRHRNDE